MVIMDHAELIKIVTDIIIHFPLIMSLVLVFDYRLNGKYNVEIKIKEFEDINIEKDIIMNLIIRFIKRVNNIISEDGIYE